jgi:diguanylate cyclase (GGDEF)-like protein
MSDGATTLPGDPAVPEYVLDAGRLAAVRQSGLLDSGPEAELDRFTRLAAALTGAPIARLSILDDVGQHFKSALGALPPSGRFTPLSHAICKHVVGDRAPLSIPDTGAEPRVAHNGAVTEHGTGAYLGHPVRSPDGHVLGAFCVAAPEPREWTPGDLRVVADLAAAIETELALRAALEASHERVFRDALTGLQNRRSLTADLEAAFDEGRRFMLVMADLDGFKDYNDRYGHPAGDRMLTSLARRLRAVAERLGGRAYRMSGDEFCVLCDQSAAPDVAAQIEAALRKPSQESPIGASTGTVLVPQEARTPQDALDLVDERMYAHKRSGRLSTVGQVRLVLTELMTARDAIHALRGQAAGRIAVLAARELGFDAADVADIVVACELCDVGALAVDDPTGAAEHAVVSERVLLAAPALAHVASLVRSHHERIDGSGFPDGLSGDRFGLAARVVSAAGAIAELAEPAGTPGTLPLRGALELVRARGQHDAGVLDALAAALARRRAACDAPRATAA